MAECNDDDDAGCFGGLLLRIVRMETGYESPPSSAPIGHTFYHTHTQIRSVGHSLLSLGAQRGARKLRLAALPRN